MRRILRSALGVCLLCFVEAYGIAAPYKYEVIDANSDVYYGPFVTNDGAVIWSGSTTVDGERQAGIFRWVAGTTTRVVPQAGAFLGFSGLAVSDNGTIAFTAGDAVASSGAYRLDESGIVEIATPSTGAISASVQDVNDRGEVLYLARVDAASIASTELHVGTGDTDRTLAGTALPGRFFGGTINNLGTVAYSIMTSSATGDIWLFDSSGAGTIVDLPDGFGYGQPAINDSGDFAAITRLNGQGVSLYSAGGVQQLTNDPSKIYYADSLPTLNNRGQIVARSQDGLEIAPTPHEVLFVSGHLPLQLDGLYLSAGSGFGFGRDINDRGQVVANLAYTNSFGHLGVGEALVLATPVPEPASALLLLCSLATFPGLGGRHNTAGSCRRAERSRSKSRVSRTTGTTSS
jgi:hypothetical protein